MVDAMPRPIALCAAAALLACSGGGRTSPDPTEPTMPEPTSADAAPAAASDDPYLWLEEVEGERALAWARERNRDSQAELEAVPGFTEHRDRLRAILDSKDKIPYVGRRGAHYYNTWQDEAHPRGLWRRTSLAEFKKATPRWETVLDVDALAAADKENWVWGGPTCLPPAFERCLISLSRGGADATVVREFDIGRKQFVDGGFALPEAKSEVAWKDADTIYVATDFGPGSMTDAGYPRIVKEWKRGTPLSAATTVFEGKASDVSVSAARTWEPGHTRDLVTRIITFFTSETFLREGTTLTKIDVPDDASPGFWGDYLVVTLRSDWTVGGATWAKGALLAIPWTRFAAGDRAFTALFTPAANRSLAGISALRSALIVNELEDVHNRLYQWRVDRAGRFTRTDFPAAAGLTTTSVSAVDPLGATDEYWLYTSGFTTPSTLALGALGGAVTQLKQSPAFFDAKGVVVEQHFATSRDGTRVPYFQMHREGLALDGQTPTLLTGYGGFELSLTPDYDPFTGASWVERGGVAITANIRGGGEYGPGWHQAALGHHRQRAYDDFIAVAEDLIRRKVTSPARLGIQGGSNGGLLVGVMLTQRPDLFGAVVCEVPLLDMRRYHKLLAGASWMAEYGDPDDPADWAAISAYSPYQNVKPGVKYPRTLFTSSTRDDRVHPGHARKMVARMREQGHDLLYYENIEGGHGGAANHEQAAYLQALSYAFLRKQLGLR